MMDINRNNLLNQESEQICVCIKIKFTCLEAMMDMKD